jgi:hypothetical protein
MSMFDIKISQVYCGEEASSVYNSAFITTYFGNDSDDVIDVEESEIKSPERIVEMEVIKTRGRPRKSNSSVQTTQRIKNKHSNRQSTPLTKEEIAKSNFLKLFGLVSKDYVESPKMRRSKRKRHSMETKSDYKENADVKSPEKIRRSH